MYNISKRLPDQRRTIIYTRVSTDEQADKGYSLRDQEARLRDYCRRTGRDVVAHYQDDHSAKTFDRPEFQKMLAYIDKNSNAVDELLVVKWDRFSRDMTGALNMINRLRDYGVEMQAVEQRVDWEVPEQQMMVAVYLATPEIENRRRSINTMMGMRRAMREGRWCTRPPLGFKRYRGENNQPSLAPSDRAPVVLKAFKMAAETDLPLEEIRRRLRADGLRVSRSRFIELLKAPVYKGRIHIKAWRDEPEEEVEGLHEAIVPPSLWNRVQEVRFGQRSGASKRRGQPRLDLILRGHLACPYCSDKTPELVTGSLSRGRLGTRYAYYHCHRCGDYRVRADDAHDAIPGFLRRLQITPEVADLYQAVAGDFGRQKERNRRDRAAALRRRLQLVEGKLFKAEEAFIEGNIEIDSLKRLKGHYDEEVLAIREELSEVEADAEEVTNQISQAAELLKVLPAVWNHGMASEEAEVLSDLMGSIIPEKIVFDEEVIRTPWGCSAKALFELESRKIEDAAPEKDAASCKVAHLVQLSNRFTTEMQRLFELEPVLPVTLLEPLERPNMGFNGE